MSTAQDTAGGEPQPWGEVNPDAARRLLVAAVEAFAERGYHATTTRDIAGRAGMSPAALYIHYKTKEELLHRISRIGHDRALLLLETAAPADSLIAVLDTLTLTESDTGLAVEADELVPATTKLVKELPGIGLAEVAPLVPEVVATLPRWAGTPVEGGELYRDEARPGAPVLVLVSDTSSTTLLLDGGGPEADTATELTAGLTITWEAPG